MFDSAGQQKWGRINKQVNASANVKMKWAKSVGHWGHQGGNQTRKKDSGQQRQSVDEKYL